MQTLSLTIAALFQINMSTISFFNYTHSSFSFIIIIIIIIIGHNAGANNNGNVCGDVVNKL